MNVYFKFFLPPKLSDIPKFDAPVGLPYLLSRLPPRSPGFYLTSVWINSLMTLILILLGAPDFEIQDGALFNHTFQDDAQLCLTVFP